MKILIVEDDPYHAFNLTELLSFKGIETAVAGSVQATLRMSLDDLDGIISDVMLPNDPAESGISPEWTETTPTKPGWYWLWENKSPKPDIVRVHQSKCSREMLVIVTDSTLSAPLSSWDTVFCLWAGPIPQPEEP